MRYFLTLLFSVTIFCAYSQVTIPDKTARYFLERDELATIQTERLLLKDSLIKNLGTLLVNKDIIIQTYKKDSTNYELVIVNMDSMLSDKSKLIKAEKKLIRKTENQRDVVIGAGSGAIIGAALGQPLIGGAIGAGVAIIRNRFKKRIR